MSGTARKINLINKLGEGAHSEVYIAEEKSSHVAIKFPKKTDPKTSLVELRREASLMARIHNEGLPRILGISDFEGRPYLSMELIVGGTLEKILAVNNLNLDQVIIIFFHLAKTLNYIHSSGIVHRDLNPQNIIIGEDGKPRLIDFGLAANLNRNNEVDSAVIGTIKFASPEQIGVIDAPVTQASDLYSLGAIIFKCLTGQAPFEANDLNQLLEMQSKFNLPPLSNYRNDIPQEIISILQLLLQKDPYSRYHSAQELLNDLFNYVKKEKPALNLHFEKDESVWKKFVGREEELIAIKNALVTSQKENKGCLVQIEGLPGSGKSRLAQEILKLKTLEKNELVKIQFQQNTTPLQALRESFRTLLKKKKETFLKASAQREQVLVSLLPELSTQLSARPISNISEDSYLQTLAEFIYDISEELNGLTLYFDDFQWIDSPTQKVFNKLTTLIKKSSMVLIITTRESILKKNSQFDFLKMASIQLKTFSERDIKNIVQSYLPQRPISDEIYNFFIEKADGTPFLTLEYLRLLLENGAIFPTESSWVLDRSVLSDSILSGDIVQALLSKLSQASPNTLKTLATAGVLGLNFSETLLTQILDDRTLKVSESLEQAKRLHLIEQTSDKEWTFLHDRLRQAFLTHLSFDEQQELHSKASFAYQHNDQLLLSARHVLFLEKPSDPRANFDLLIAAAKLATNQHGDDEALLMLNKAFEISVKYEIQIQPFHFELQADVFVKKNNLKSAIEFYTKAIEGSPKGLDRAHILLKLSQVYYSNSDLKSANLMLDKALADMNKIGPNAPLLLQVWHSFQALIQIFSSPWTRLSQENRKQAEFISHLFDFAAVLTFHELRPVALVFVFIMSAAPALRSRQQRLILTAYCNMGVLFSIFSFKNLSRRALRAAEKVAQQIQTPEAWGHYNVYHGMAMIFLGDEVLAEKSLREVYEKYGKWVNHYDYVLGAGSLMTVLQARGHSKSGLEFISKCLAHIDNDDAAMKRVWFWCHHIGVTMHAQLGDQRSIAQSLRLINKDMNVAPFDLALYCTNDLNLRLEMDEVDVEAELTLSEYKKMNLSFIQASPYFISRIVVIEGYILAKRILKSEEPKKLELIQTLKKSLLKMNLYSRLPYVKAHHLVLKSILNFHLGKNKKGLSLLEPAEKYFRSTDDRIGLYEVYTLRALLMKSLGDITSAKVNADAAHSLAVKNSWIPRVNRLVQLFPESKDFLDQNQFTSLKYEGGTKDLFFEKKLRAVHELHLSAASIFDTTELQKKVLDFTVNLLQAERALLFLFDENNQLNLAMARGANEVEGTNTTTYSRTAINQCLKEEKPFLMSAVGDQIIQEAQSVVAHGLKSIIVCPLKFKDRLLGILYLDNRIARGVFSSGDKDILLDLSQHIAISIEQAKTVNLEISNAEMRKDLELTGVVQKYLLPTKENLTVPQLKMTSFYRPAVESGGDWWQWYQNKENHIRILVGDVTGHGAGPAMVTAVLSGAFQSFREHRPQVSLTELATHLNQILVQMCQGQYWMSLTAVDWLTETKELEWTTLGSQPILIISKETAETEVLQESHNQLGQSQFSPKTYQHKITSPSRVLIFTDGLLEGHNAEGRSFGLKNIERYMKHSLQMNLDDVRDGLFKRLQDFTQSSGYEDDISYILLDIDPS